MKVDTQFNKESNQGIKIEILAYKKVYWTAFTHDKYINGFLIKKKKRKEKERTKN